LSKVSRKTSHALSIYQQKSLGLLMYSPCMHCITPAFCIININEDDDDDDKVSVKYGVW